MNLLLQDYWQKPVLIWRRVNKWQSRQGQDVVVSVASGTTGITVRIAGGLNDSKKVDTGKSFC